MKAKSVIMVSGKWMVVWVLFCLLSLPFGCSSGGSSGSDGGPGIDVHQVKLSMMDTNEMALANGEDSYVITAQVLDKYGVGIGDSNVSLAAVGTKGVVAFHPAARGVTGADGTYTVNVTNVCSEDDFFMVRANAGGKSVEKEVRFLGIPIPRYLGLSLSKTTVKSDNSDSAEITATVLDDSRSPLENITVAFQTSVEGSLAGGGQISSSTVSTDENGQAAIEFRSGTVEKKNQTVTIEAWVPAFLEQENLRKMIPIQVVGSTLSLSVEKTNLVVDPANTDRVSTPITVTVKDAGGNPINDAEVTFEQLKVDGGVKGEVNITPSYGRTDVNGKFAATVTGITSGTITVLAKSAGVQASQVFNIGKMGEIFSIERPIQDTVRMTTQECLKIQVMAPATEQVRFATSIGSFVSSQCCACDETSNFCNYLAGCGQGEKSIVANVDSNHVATVYLRSENPGIANIVAMDANDPSSKDKRTVVVSETVEMAANLSLKASATIVAPSVGTTQNNVTLTVNVSNEAAQPIGGAPVAFSIENPTGGGEKVSPVIVFTDKLGRATSTFTSGSLNSGASGVTIKAKMIRNAGKPELSDTVAVFISSTVTSIEFGRGTLIESNETDTMYSLPISLIVTDAQGNPVADAAVSLSTWPVRYASGYWAKDEDGNDCSIVYTGWHDNEDINRNLILDPEEDLNEDGQLTPPRAAAGTLPKMVTTGENGTAEFLLIYPKISAGWIEAEISAITQILGGENTKSVKSFILPVLEGEECNLPNAPYAPPTTTVDMLRVTALSSNGQGEAPIADGTDYYDIYAQVFDSTGRPVAGQLISFIALNTTGVVVVDPPSGISADNGTVLAKVRYINSVGGSFILRVSSNEKRADLRLTFKKIGSDEDDENDNESRNEDDKNLVLKSQSYNPNSMSLSESDFSKSQNLQKTSKSIGPDGHGLVDDVHSQMLGNFKIESSLWNLPGLAYGNRMTQIIGYSTYEFVDSQLLQGIPLSFFSEPGLSIDNENVLIGEEGRAMTIGRTQLSAIAQETTPKESMLMDWETELIEYVSNTYNKDFFGYPANGLRNVSVYMNKKDNSDKIILADTDVILSGQPIILFDRDSFALENGESAQVKVLISDENLNPLSPGTTVRISMNNGNLSGRVENTYQNSNVIGPDVHEHLKLIEYRLNISDPDPAINQYQADSITVNVEWEGITIRSRLEGSIR